MWVRISIHALREEGDFACAAYVHAHPDFYPRPPRGGRLSIHMIHHLDTPISIHALREEGDGLL